MITAAHITYPEIPQDAGRVTGWKDIPIKENDYADPLVPLGPLSTEAATVMTSAIYFGEHSNSPYAKSINKLEGSLLTLFARQSVARRLLVAERLLPAGYHLIVFDAYRPYQVQKSLYDFYKRKLAEKYPDMDNNARASETQKYVSLPSTDPARPSPHNTGGAVDVAVVKLDRVYEEELPLSVTLRRHSKMLDFGTAFDHGGEKSALTYYESKIAAGETLTGIDRRACDNRRLLFAVMTQAGFQPYFAEWWHFNAPESQMGAAAAGRGFATFGAVYLDESNRAHENRRLKARQKVLRSQKDSDATLAENWPAEIIAPPEA
jgi:D-alanyl-D-alanine dipeptidase